MSLTVTAIEDRIQTEADAYFYLEELRSPTGEQTCPHCGNLGGDYIAPTNGTSRKTRTGSMSEGACGAARAAASSSRADRHPFHGTKIAVRKWVFVIFKMCSSKNGFRPARLSANTACARVLPGT
jgi:hypothetical protein